MKLAATFCLILVFQMLTAQVKAQSEPKPELMVQTGHSDMVVSIVYSPDGKYMASGSLDSTVKIWNIETGTELRTLRGLSGGVPSVAFSPDGKIIAAASYDYEIKFWNVETGEEIRTLKTQGEKWQAQKDAELPSILELQGVRSIVFSPDGKKLVSGGNSNLRLWDVETGKNLLIFAGHTDAISKVVFSPEGTTIASSSTDKTVRLWDAATGKELRTLAADMYASDLAYNPAYREIAAADANGIVKLWDTTDGHEVGSNKIDGNIDSIAFSRDGKTLAVTREMTIQPTVSSPAAGGTEANKQPDKSEQKKHDILLFDMETGKIVRTLNENSSLVVFSPDGQTMAGIVKNDFHWWDLKSGTDAVKSGDIKTGKDTIKIWDVKSGKVVRTLGRSTSSANSLKFSPDGKKLTSGNSDGTVRFWNIGGEISSKTLAGHYLNISQIALSPDGKQMVSGGWDRQVKLWDTESETLLRSFERDWNVDSVAFGANGKDLVYLSNGTIFFFNALDGQETGFNFVANEFAEKVVFSPDGNFWAAGYGMGSLRLWKTGEQNPFLTLTVEQNGGSLVAFSPDGKLLVSGGRSGTVKIFKTGSGVPLQTIAGNENSGLNEIAFSPDGKILAGAGSDATIKFWDARTGKLLKTLSGHRLSVNSLTFSPDGKILASSGEDTAIKLWDVATGKELISLYAFGDTNWIAVTPEGLFDGMQAAWRQLAYRFNNNTFNFAPVEAFFKEFYYPGLLEEVLQGKTPRPPKKNLAQVDMRPPGVTFLAINRQKVEGAENLTVDQPTVKIAVGVVENPRGTNNPKLSPTGGARHLRLFRNGSLVKIWNKSVFDLTEADGCQQLPPTKDIPVRRAVCEAEVQAVAGDNNFSVYAFNNDNVKSIDAELKFKGADTLKRSGTLYVLAIGANEYANPNYNLRYAVADVESIAQALKAQQTALNNYAKTEVVELTNQNATKANIFAALNRFSNDKTTLPVNAPADLQKIKKLQPEDALVIYYAGHGTASKDRFYLIPHDGFPLDGAGDKYYEELYARSVSDENLESLLETVDAGKILLVIDACNSGQALEAEEKRRGPMNSKGLAQLAYEKGIYILTAAQNFQSALEVSQTADGKVIEHGLLTYSLLEGLKAAKADVNSDKQVSEREWLNFAVAQVPQLQIETMRRRDAKINENPARRSTAVSISGGKSQLSTPDRGLQTPRVFYRREDDAKPLVVAAQ